MYAAPVRDLNKALLSSALGDLNPFPWVVMSGNCFGWLVYACYTHDPFILAANIPGLLVSFYLNIGACKLEYKEQKQQFDRLARATPQQQENLDINPEDQATRIPENVDINGTTITATNTGYKSEGRVMTTQEQMFFVMMTLWSIIVVFVGWFDLTHGHAKQTFGFCANINVIFFYASPLQAIKRIVDSKTSNEIHIPTVIIGWTNAIFWMAYGFARRDLVISIPNGIAMLLSSTQGLLCCIYPRKNISHSTAAAAATTMTTSGVENDDAVDPTPLLQGETSNGSSKSNNRRGSIDETTLV
jgi:solute carrier family 50 protein (sugar transporter)